MPLDNYGQIVARVRRRLRDTGIDDDIKEEINIVYQEVLSQERWWFIQRNTTFVTVASQADYTLNSSTLADNGTISMLLFLWQTTSPAPMDRINFKEWHRSEPNPTSEATPRQWAFLGATTSGDPQIRLRSIPNAVIIINVLYDAEVSDMSNDSDVPIIPKRFRSILVTGACRNIWLAKNDDAKVATNDTLYLRSFKKMLELNEIDNELRFARRPDDSFVYRRKAGVVLGPEFGHPADYRPW